MGPRDSSSGSLDWCRLDDRDGPYDISPDGKTLVVSLTEVMRGAKELHVIARRLPR